MFCFSRQMLGAALLGLSLALLGGCGDSGAPESPYDSYLTGQAALVSEHSFQAAYSAMLAKGGTPIPLDEAGREEFEKFKDSPVKLAAVEPVSTFSVDVDTASYSFVRRRLDQGAAPRPDAVRVEEMVNYFDYAYALPEDDARPFRPNVVVTDSPWGPGRKLMHIGIKGYDVVPDARPRANLVFLMDVSGSMSGPDRLPLLVRSMKMLLDTLEPEDTVALVVYASESGTVLEPTPVSRKREIVAALDRLEAGGSTAGGQGLAQAYALAERNFDPEAVNRIFIATDGDFNVGISDREELKAFVARKRDQGIYLSVLGFGRGNYNDALMQALAQNGNGVAAYIDTLAEARKILVTEASSTLFPIARDVKIQVEFNPARVAEYRLIGYETRALAQEDFSNDKVDAGDIGSGHTVTAIYEITPVGADASARMLPERRYAPPPPSVRGDRAKELAFVRIRYKLPGEDASRLIETPVTEAGAVASTEALRRDVRWATAVAGFGQILRGGTYTGGFDYDDVIALAQPARGEDPYGYRAEFVQMVRAAKTAQPPPERVR